jgi:uncharacterized protein DUF4397
MKRFLALVSALGVGFVVALLGMPPASAQSAGWIRLAHLSPDAFDVDVYVAPFRGGNQVVLRKVGYGDVSNHQRLAPGRYTVSMRQAGASSVTPAILSTEVEVAEGAAYTVAGMGLAAQLRLDVLRDELSIPPSGQSRVRVIQASAGAKTAEVTVGDTSAGAVKFASTSPYLEVAAGRLAVGVQPEGAAGASKQEVQLSAGAVYSLAVLDAPGSGIKVVPLLDAAGSGNMPASVNAGLGGAARDSGDGDGLRSPVAAIGLVLVAGVARAVTARRRRA